MKKRIVIALGGNALGNTPTEQMFLVKKTAKMVVDLIASGIEVIITHGNGPQVGMINLGMCAAAENKIIPMEIPFPECGAMSQGYIGYHLQNSISNEFAMRNIHKNVATIITQVVVDCNDCAFNNPTKPIGAFYTEAEAIKIENTKGYCMRQDSNRGFRRVVPSPRPIDIVEKNIISSLVNEGNVIITAGGGGVPVVYENRQYVGVAAVIDKDFVAAKIAEVLDADMLIILTAVEQVAINWGKTNQKFLKQMTLEEAKIFCEEGQFAAGSMLPKIQAAMDFVQSGKIAVIASLDKVIQAVYGESGTIILPKNSAKSATA
ncbi:MAG: carbamate kinase [Ruthenibacterium sp.]